MKISNKLIELFELLFVRFVMPTSCSSGHAYFTGAGGLGFLGQSNWAQSAANGLPRLQDVFERSCVARRRMTQRLAPQIHYTLCRNATSITKRLIGCLVIFCVI